MLENISKLGTTLNNSEAKKVNGGLGPAQTGSSIVHGACNNGTHFSFAFSIETYEASLAQIRSTFCAGGGIAWVDAIAVL